MSPSKRRNGSDITYNYGRQARRLDIELASPFAFPVLPVAIAVVLVAIALIAYASSSPPEYNAYQRRNQGRFDSYGAGRDTSGPLVVGDTSKRVYKYHPSYLTTDGV